ncbi:hypothetical protein [Bradyrhizobium sp. HKCCYLS20291]|uniref:hypothetical protein n=1 Tax=Bradyrhizobium sp. HKCCYLS20291 TaxID=3420766 RepID=UPI003EBACF62
MKVDKNRHTEVEKLQIAGLTWSFAPFGLIFMAKKFLLSAIAADAAEQTTSPTGTWQPVPKYLACHSIELALKAFLTLKNSSLKDARRFSHDIQKLLEEALKRGLEEYASLSSEQKETIARASSYYNEKVFEYPSLPEAAQAYPGDPPLGPLIAAAQALVSSLYEPCQEA